MLCSEEFENSRNPNNSPAFGKICCCCGDLLDGRDRIVMKITMNDGWDYVHEDCLEDLSPTETLEMLGIEVEEIDM